MLRTAVLSLPMMTLRQLRRTGQMALACAALAALSACGGGERAEEYKPDRVVAFGDENSAFFNAEVGASSGNFVRGLVYSVNVLGPSALTGPITLYCDDVGTSAPCANEGSALGFVATAAATLPFGAGVFVTPTSSRDSLNAVRLLADGSATYTPASPASAASSVTSVKQDRYVQYTCDADVSAIQHIAHGFGKGFPASTCPLETRSGATTYAEAGAKISGLQAQVNAALGQGQLGKGALVTVWIGQNDIKDVATDNVTYVSQTAKSLEVKTRADRLAQVIKQILGTGAKVVVVGVTDIGLSPWASSAGLGTTPANIQELVAQFNLTLRLGDKDTGLKGLQDYTFRGRDYTFVDSGDIVRSLVSNTGYINKRACANPGDLTPVAPASAPAASIPSVKPDGTVAAATEVQYCTSATLVTSGNPTSYLWADDYRPGWTIHEAIANTALSRVVNQF
jgi:hypothetical protein